MSSRQALSVYIIACTLFCRVVCGTAKDVYVDAKKGRDAAGCGTTSTPCQTLSFAWSVAREKSTLVRFLLNHGEYHDKTVVDFDCSGKTVSVHIKGDTKGSIHTKLGSSLLVTNCQLNISDLTIFHSHDRIRQFYYFANITFQNIVMMSTAINLLGEQSTVFLQNSTILNCTSSIDNVPLFTLKSGNLSPSYFVVDKMDFLSNNLGFAFLDKITLANFKGTKIALNNVGSNNKVGTSQGLHIVGVEKVIVDKFSVHNNTNFGIHIAASPNTFITNGEFIGNSASEHYALIDLNGGRFRLSQMLYSQNRFNHNVSVLNIGGNSTLACLGCIFECNTMNGLENRSPITFSVNPKLINISSSVVKKCPVVCEAGHYLKSDLLCIPCPKGAYMPSSNATMAMCHRCPVGMYAERQKSLVCKACMAGFFCAVTGCSKCKKCKNDFFTASIGAASCNKPTILFLVLVVFTSLFIFLPALIMVINRGRKRLVVKKEIYEEDSGYDNKSLLIN